MFDEDGWLLPPDGEEGELIDEACFIAARTERVKGIGESHYFAAHVDDHESHIHLRCHRTYATGTRAIYPFLP